MNSAPFSSMRSRRIFLRLVIPVSMTLLFVVLGVIGGLGYRVNSIKELSFVPHAGYADSVISFSATYNPLLYPFYWIKGMGYINGTFSLMLIPISGYSAETEFPAPVWGLKPSDRYDDYIDQMITWGFYGDLIVLFLISLLIEAAKARMLFMAMLFGILGFYVAVVPGMLVGLIVAVTILLFIRFMLPRDNLLSRFWYSLWE